MEMIQEIGVLIILKKAKIILQLIFIVQNVERQGSLSTSTTPVVYLILKN